MQPTTTDWGPGLIMFGVGAILAVVAIVLARRRSQPMSDPTPDDAQARYDGLIAELKEHAANKHLAAPEVWAAEQRRLEHAAASVLRQRDTLKHEQLKAQGRAEARAASSHQGFFGTHAALKGALVGGGLVAFVAFAAWQLTHATSARDDGMVATGGGAPPQAPMQRPDSTLEKLKADAEAQPQNADAVAAVALAYLRKQRFEEAVPYVQRGTMIDPFHVRTRVGRGVLRALNGDLPGAQSELESLAQKYPEAYDGLLFAGMMAMERQDRQQAIANFEQYLARAGSEAPPMMRRAVEELKSQR